MSTGCVYTYNGDAIGLGPSLDADSAEDFCVRHGLSQYDSRLVSWLVRHHLTMSTTAQRRDLSDPEVIEEFASEVGDSEHLEYLYLLTVADIRGTNPTLWNAWRGSLLRQLYTEPKRAFTRGLEQPVEKSQLIEQTLLRHGGNRAAAARELGLDRANFSRLLKRLG